MSRHCSVRLQPPCQEWRHFLQQSKKTWLTSILSLPTQMRLSHNSSLGDVPVDRFALEHVIFAEHFLNVCFLRHFKVSCKFIFSFPFRSMEILVGLFSLILIHRICLTSLFRYWCCEPEMTKTSTSIVMYLKSILFPSS